MICETGYIAIVISLYVHLCYWKIYLFIAVLSDKSGNIISLMDHLDDQITL